VFRLLRSTVTKNATSLYSIQFASYVLPLITVPYLVRVLKPERFGTVAFGQGLIAYFMALVEYGFGLSATRRISAARENHELVSRVASNIVAARVLLCAGSFSLLICLIYFVPRLHEASTLLLVLYGSVIGMAIFPSYLFQGLERMSPIAVINLSVRIVAILAMFVVVRREEDYLAYAALISAQSIVAAVVGVWAAFRMFQLHAVWPTWSGIGNSLKEGWITFLSISAITLYTSGNAFILGMLTNDVVVGYYSAAEKIVRAAVAVLGPISQAAYPRFAKMAVESKEMALRWARRMLLLMGGVGFLITAAIFACSGLIVHLVLGARFQASGPVMRILALLPLLVAISNVLGIQILFPFRQDRVVLVSVTTGGLVNVALAFLLAPVFQARGMAVSAVVAEFLVTATQIYYIVKMGLNPLNPMPDGQAMAQEGPSMGGLEI
jgi:PST family polysaccharide transporter